MQTSVFTDHFVVVQSSRKDVCVLQKMIPDLDNYFAPLGGLQSIVISLSVCLSVSVGSHNSKTT